MSRVVIPEGSRFNSYHLLRLVSSYGEHVLEDSVRQHVTELFPDYHVIPYKKDVVISGINERKRPDLAIIRKDFSDWGIIEVEISNHSLHHVIDQVSVFQQGDYNSQEVARYLKENIREHCGKRISLQRIQKLVAEEVPKIFVVVDEVKEEWKKQLGELGVEMCFFELYKDTHGRHLYRAYGKYPIIPMHEAHVRRAPASANLFEITTEFTFKNAKRNRVFIIYNEISTEWVLLHEQGKQYLRFAGGSNPLSMTDSYVIFSDRHERYYIRKN